MLQVTKHISLVLGDLSPQTSFKGKNAWRQGTCLMREASAHVRARTIKTIFVAEKFKFFGKELFSGERFIIQGLFYTNCNMAMSVQNPMLR